MTRPIKFTVENVIAEIESYKNDGVPMKISKLSAQNILDDFYENLPQHFCDYINDRIMDGDLADD